MPLLYLPVFCTAWKRDTNITFKFFAHYFKRNGRHQLLEVVNTKLVIDQYIRGVVKTTKNMNTNSFVYMGISTSHSLITKTNNGGHDIVYFAYEK